MANRVQIPLWRSCLIVAVYGALFWLFSWDLRAILAVELLTAFALLSLFYRSRPDLTVGVLAIVFGLQGNVMALLIAMTIFACGPPGSSVRPDFVLLYLLGDAVATAACALPKAILAICRRGQRMIGLSALLLGLSPVPVGLVALYAIVVVFGYKLHP